MRDLHFQRTPTVQKEDPMPIPRHESPNLDRRTSVLDRGRAPCPRVATTEDCTTDTTPP
jgi:hypothetical protein